MGKHKLSYLLTYVMAETRSNARCKQQQTVNVPVKRLTVMTEFKTEGMPTLKTLTKNNNKS